MRHRFVKEKNRSHIINLTSNHQINKQSPKISNKKFSFRLARFASLRQSQRVCLLQWHSVSSLQRLVNLLQWNSISESQRSQKRMRSILYIFAVNINGNESITYSDTGANGIKRWKTTVNVSLIRSQFSSSSSQSSVRSSKQSTFCQSNLLFQNLQSIRTCRLIKTRKAQIREVWDSIRSRNRYRFAASISAFAFALFWDIDRFIILICKYLRDQDFQQDSHSRRIYLSFFFSHIFCFRIYLFTSIASAMKFSASTLIRQILESSSMNFFAMSTDRRNEYSLRNETWRRRENSVTSMSGISIGNLSYQRESIWKLARSRTWRSQSTSDIRFSVHICFLDQIFSLCYLLSPRHAPYI